MLPKVRLNRLSSELPPDAQACAPSSEESNLPSQMRRLEEALQRDGLVDTFQRIIDGLPEQIALVDESWTILAVNEAWLATSLLYTSDELMPGSNYLDFCRLKSAEGYAAAAEAIEGAEKVAKREQEAFSFVYQGVDRWEGITFQTCIRQLEINNRIFATITRHNISELVELRQSRETFSDLLVESQADERRRVASDVHDSTMQILVAVGLAIGRLRHQQSPGARDSTMSELEGLVSDAQKELRSIAYLAHPPLIREVGFVRALQVLTEGYGRRTGLKVSMQVDSPIDMRWRHTEVVLYRVVQEALANVHRHAKAKKVIVRLFVSRRGMLHALIVDDGVGISARARAGVGLQSMRARLKEHGGRLSICRGTPGTIVIASLPGQPHLRSTGDLKVRCP